MKRYRVDRSKLLNKCRDILSKDSRYANEPLQKMGLDQIALMLGKPRGGGLRISEQFLENYFGANLPFVMPSRNRKPRQPRVPREPRKLKATRLSSVDFYESREWRELRYKALKEHGAKCQCCGSSPADGIRLHVDHIKPRSKFPALQLVLSNLQVLCADCNLGKSNKDDTDWRPASAAIVSMEDFAISHLRAIK